MASIEEQHITSEHPSQNDEENSVTSKDAIQERANCEDTPGPLAMENVIQEERANHQDVLLYIKNGKAWKILVYGTTEYSPEQKAYHAQLLNGIVGHELQLKINEKDFSASQAFHKNGVKVEIHVGSHNDCKVTPDDVDLLLVFIPVIQIRNDPAIHNSCPKLIKQITAAREKKIWEYSVVVLTGIDRIMDEYNTGVTDRLEVLISALRVQINTALESATGDKGDIDLNVKIAGRSNQPDLPRPHQKWFSQLCLECYLSSKKESIPAAIKLSQDRIVNNVKNREIVSLRLSQQPIQVCEDYAKLTEDDKIRLGIGGGGTLVVLTATGATIGALVGALATGIPSFGVAAGAGLAIGVAAGGGIGAGVASAVVSKGLQASKDRKQQSLSNTLTLQKHYGQLLARLPPICEFLSSWAREQMTCKVVVVGLEKEGVSTIAAALANQELRKKKNSGLYWKQIVHEKANLIAYDFPSLSKDPCANIYPKAQEVLTFFTQKDADVMIFCIQMTESRENFVHSPHMRYLSRFFEIEKSIFSHLVIVLTHANEMREGFQNSSNDREFQVFFKNECAEWKNQVNTTLRNHINLGITCTDVPVLPAGNCHEYTFDISDNQSDSPAGQYHWLSKLLLDMMPVTKSKGLPTLITANRMELQRRQQPVDSEEQVNVPELENAQELIKGAQCLMFSQIGKKKKMNPGEAIGLILGERDDRSW